MESYYNMGSSNGRDCKSMMNPNCRPAMNTGCSPCGATRPSMRPEPRHNCGNMHQMPAAPMPCNNMVEVECECKVKETKNCHRPDEMTKLGKEFPTVMAYVPWQQWGALYDAECGLKEGTIFKELNLIFCGVRC